MSAVVLLADVVQQRDLNQVEARALVDGMRRDVSDLGERIATAYIGRAWVALGHDSWDALCDAEFDGARLRIPREQRVEQVQSLRSAGLSTRAIGSALGVDPSTVRADLSTAGNPPVDTVTSLDGRTRPASQPPRPTSPPASVPTEEAAPAAPGAAPDAGEVDLTGCALSRDEYVAQHGDVTPPPRAEPKRRALPDQFFDAAFDLVKAVERVRRLTEDDRFARNAEQLAAKHRSELTRTAEALAGVLATLPN